MPAAGVSLSAFGPSSMRSGPLEFLRRSLGLGTRRSGARRWRKATDSLSPVRTRPLEGLAGEHALFAPDLMRALARVDFVAAPAIPNHELFQLRRLAARLGILAAAGLDVQVIGAEQMFAAAQLSFQKNKVFVSRCEYDLEVNDDVLAVVGRNLRPDFYWYATNNRASDPRVISLPLGLLEFCNYSAFHQFAGDTTTFAAIRAAPGPRRGVLKCFDPNSYRKGRSLLARTVAGWDALIDVPLAKDAAAFRRYLEHLAAAEFCLCPRGKGIDTHRFWEALYMGALPVMLRADMLRCHEGLPCLVVDSWQELLHLDLGAIAVNLRRQQYDLRSLTIAHWVGRISASARES